MAIFGSIEKPVLRVLSQLFADPGLAETVTYRVFTGVTFDDALQRNVVAKTDYSIDAIRLRHNMRSVQVARSAVEIGDLVFMFKAADMPAGYSTKDRIIDAGGNEYVPKAADDIFGLAVSVTVQS